MLSPVVIYPLWAKIGHSSVGHHTLTADIVLPPIAAYPFLTTNGYSLFGAFLFCAEIGYSPFGAFPFCARIGYGLVVAFPVLARNGHSSAGDSTLTTVRVLASKKIGNSQKNQLFSKPFPFPCRIKMKRTVLSDQDKTKQYFESDQ